MMTIDAAYGGVQRAQPWLALARQGRELRRARPRPVASHDRDSRHPRARDLVPRPLLLPRRHRPPGGRRRAMNGRVTRPSRPVGKAVGAPPSRGFAALTRHCAEGHATLPPRRQSRRGPTLTIGRVTRPSRPVAKPRGPSSYYREGHATLPPRRQSRRGPTLLISGGARAPPALPAKPSGSHPPAGLAALRCARSGLLTLSRRGTRPSRPRQVVVVHATAAPAPLATALLARCACASGIPVRSRPPAHRRG